MSFAMSDRTLRHEGLRWGVCFTVAVAAHGAALLALLHTPSPPDADFETGAAVVMVDLPTTPAALQIPPSDLAPGPVEEQSDATPTPKEETKPPEQTAEVALPKPDPPKPEPPSEERPATAPPSVAMAVPNEAPPTAGVETPEEPQPPSAAIRRWQSMLQARIARLKRYPARARARHEEGTVSVIFTVDRNGRVLESHVYKSSGSPDLDRELLSMVAHAQPLPKPPPDAKPGDLVFELGMNFNLK